MAEPEYIQLQSWEELIAWLEKKGYTREVEWNPKPKRKKKKLDQDRLF